jgi:mannose-1-phosphate guanylyltransferase/mannose-6-phosphate isomerase
MKTSETITPVILSGGAGSRLWPASRTRQPKQLLPLVDERTMLLTTIERAGAIPGSTAPLIVGNREQRNSIGRELHAAGWSEAPVILEPIGRNTAPAVAVAAMEVRRSGDDPLLLVLPADHVIEDLEAFSAAVGTAASLATDGYLVTFGITPTGPATGYGYIRSGDPLAGGAWEVDEFREKPDTATAEEYVASGRYLWNSGMFLFRASRYLAELERFEAKVSGAARAALDHASRDENIISLDAESFADSPSISIDYAVMERTDRAAVVPISAGWSDVGSWNALWEIGARDDHDNVVDGDVMLLDVTGSYVRSSGRLIAAIGLEDTVIVDTPDATLVARRDRSEDVKQIVEELKEKRRREADTSGNEERPWGGFVTLGNGPGYRVLRLEIEPGGKTSLQTHEHRSEYWIVVSGVARVRIGEITRLIPEKDSVLIPAGEVHRLENPSKDETLVVIEVDVGSYVGEDDIRRYLDEYGRADRKG